jgi:hypothetical protein
MAYRLPHFCDNFFNKMNGLDEKVNGDKYFDMKRVLCIHIYILHILIEKLQLTKCLLLKLQQSLQSPGDLLGNSG